METAAVQQALPASQTAAESPPAADPAPPATLLPPLFAAEEQFECNVCLDLAKEPVVTLCGHLYCWPCLYR